MEKWDLKGLLLVAGNKKYFVMWKLYSSVISPFMTNKSFKNVMYNIWFGQDFFEVWIPLKASTRQKPNLAYMP